MEPMELAVSHTAALLMWVAGLVVVGVLLTAFFWGRRAQARETRTVSPEEQPKRPYDGPVREEREYREPDEMPHDGRRLLPHELHNGYGRSSTHPSDSQDPDDHRKGNSGSFGSGGLG
ncbi:MULTISPECIES: DUF6479 family protein [Streptomyces]|nr:MULTISPECIES: DUF6479 family protein [Streptomyces]NDZ87861.1 hypothetical protein [Streptomyces sp. SID10115]NDZ99884.1 hypothetical protein [Streptomyces sp. SID10116]NEB42791.1 hypothetical protein [Streptomyces sp. SID339]